MSKYLRIVFVKKSLLNASYFISFSKSGNSGMKVYRSFSSVGELTKDGPWELKDSIDGQSFFINDEIDIKMFLCSSSCSFITFDNKKYSSVFVNLNLFVSVTSGMYFFDPLLKNLANDTISIKLFL